jgi:hypothetical protein
MLEGLLATDSDRYKAVVEQAVKDCATGAVYNGDETWCLTPALKFYERMPEWDIERREAFLRSIARAMEFVRNSLRTTPRDGPPRPGSWTQSGYGTRFWIDDLAWVRWLFRRGREGDKLALELGYEALESLLYDHRPRSDDPRERDVPSMFDRQGPGLWNEELGLFAHDFGDFGQTDFWGRGQGWASQLVEVLEYMDMPYSGTRYSKAVDKAELTRILQKFAESLRVRQSRDGGWGTNLLESDRCGASEVSATGFITRFLARMVNLGLIDHDVFAPVCLRAAEFLVDHIDGERNVNGIQPPALMPGCERVSSENPDVNSAYGVGALLLAFGEVAKFPDSDFSETHNVSFRKSP